MSFSLGWWGQVEMMSFLISSGGWVHVEMTSFLSGGCGLRRDVISIGMVGSG